MMHRIIFTFITVIFFILSVKAEDSLFFKLIGLEKNYFTSTSNQEKTLIAFQKLNLLLLNKIQNEQSILEIDRIESEYLSSSDQLNFFWNASLINYINKNNSKAVYWFERYKESSMDSSNEVFLLSALIYSDYNSDKFNFSIVELAKRDSIFNCLSCLKKEKKSNEKNKKIKIISSSIFPGLGMMLNGDVIKGITSTVLNASSVVLINYLILNQSYFNALGWGFSLWLKFYTGNLKLTEKLIDKKQNNKLNEELNHCKINWMKLLENYPIKIKQ